MDSMNFIPYPILCHPILVPKLWGGSQLREKLGKQSGEATHIGESWELSTVQGTISQISNGAYQGVSLQDLIEKFPQELLGNSVYQRFGAQFPLLVKYIDAKEDLSVQVHPNDELAQQRHNGFGKSEMWYVVEAAESARIIAGLKPGISETDFKAAVADKSVMSTLVLHPAEKGQTYFLPAGTVHAIGAGVVLAEIQQTSDITYRLYDFDRLDNEGNLRELHLDLAWEAIDYQSSIAPIHRYSERNQAVSLVDCPYFTTDLIELAGEMELDLQQSFRIIMCIEGSISIAYGEESKLISKGETVLLPAALARVQLRGEAKLLAIHVN